MSERSPAHEEAYQLLCNSLFNGFLEETLLMSDEEIADDMIEKTTVESPREALIVGVGLARKEFEA